MAGERLRRGKGPSSDALPTAWLGRRAQGEELPPPLRKGRDTPGTAHSPRGSSAGAARAYGDRAALTRLPARHSPLAFNAPGPALAIPGKRGRPQTGPAPAVSWLSPARPIRRERPGRAAGQRPPPHGRAHFPDRARWGREQRPERPIRGGGGDSGWAGEKSEPGSHGRSGQWARAAEERQARAPIDFGRGAAAGRGRANGAALRLTGGPGGE